MPIRDEIRPDTGNPIMGRPQGIQGNAEWIGLRDEVLESRSAEVRPLGLVRDLNRLMAKPDPKRMDTEAGRPLLQGPFRMP